MQVIYKFLKKSIMYRKKKLYVINNIDNDKLNEFSEFYLASITKLFTYFTILLLQQNKLLNVNDNITRYINSNKYNDFSNITILDLMNHRGKIKRDFDEKKIELKLYTTATEVMKLFINENIIDQNARYSNIGYILLGVIIEKITKLSYFEAVKLYILDPLKMNNTGIGKTNISIYHNNKKINKKQLNSIIGGASCGSLYSCVNDLIKFGKNIFTLLDKKSIDIIIKSYIYKNFKNKQHILHNGLYIGTLTNILLEFDDNWKFKDIEIRLETNTNYDY
jgi:CubicO group peptidase (beta-lactamase class C family)